MAAKSKVPVPTTYDDLVQEFSSVVDSFKRLFPLVTKATFPSNDLKLQRGTHKAWGDEMHRELNDQLNKLVEAGKVYELAGDSQAEQAEQPQGEQAEQPQAEQPTRQRRSRAKAQTPEPEATQESTGGKTAQPRSRSRAKKGGEPVAA